MQTGHETFMRLAIEQAKQGAERGEVPVGAVLVADDGTILAQAHNSPITACDPTAHAEILVLRKAAGHISNYRLTNTTLYVTIEPCSMCAGALVHARVSRVVFGAWDQKAGACGSIYDIVRDQRLNHTIEVIPGVCQAECSTVIKDFFRGRRLKKSENSS